MTNDMTEPYVTITWCPQDIINEYGYPEEKAVLALQYMAETLEDESIAHGWGIIDSMISQYEFDNWIDGEPNDEV